MCIEDKLEKIELIRAKAQDRNNKNAVIIPMGITPGRPERYMPLDTIKRLFREKAANNNVKHCPGGIIVSSYLSRKMTKER